MCGVECDGSWVLTIVEANDISSEAVPEDEVPETQHRSRPALPTTPERTPGVGDGDCSDNGDGVYILETHCDFGWYDVFAVNNSEARFIPGSDVEGKTSDSLRAE